MFVTGTIEIQFMAYLQLLRNRLKLLNLILLNQKTLMKTNMKFNSKLLLDEISVYESNGMATLQSVSKSTHSIDSSSNIDGCKTNPNKFDWTELMKVKLFTVKKQICENYSENQKYFRTNNLDNVIQIQCIYTKLEKVSILINLAYGGQVIIILIVKFATLTSLLYFCCMIIIK